MRKLLTFVAIGLGLTLTNCTNSNTEESHHEGHDMHHHHHGSSIELEMDKDIPVYQPSELTFTNTVEVVKSDNVFHRYNTSLENEEQVKAFYLENLPKDGWIINEKESDDERIVASKDERHLTVRVFKMEYEEGEDLAFSLNLVKPKGEMDEHHH